MGARSRKSISAKGCPGFEVHPQFLYLGRCKFCMRNKAEHDGWKSMPERTDASQVNFLRVNAQRENETAEQYHNRMSLWKPQGPRPGAPTAVVAAVKSNLPTSPSHRGSVSDSAFAEEHNRQASLVLENAHVKKATKANDSKAKRANREDHHAAVQRIQQATVKVVEDSHSSDGGSETSDTHKKSESMKKSWTHKRLPTSDMVGKLVANGLSGGIDPAAGGEDNNSSIGSDMCASAAEQQRHIERSKRNGRSKSSGRGRGRGRDSRTQPQHQPVVERYESSSSDSDSDGEDDDEEEKEDRKKSVMSPEDMELLWDSMRSPTQADLLRQGAALTLPRVKKNKGSSSGSQERKESTTTGSKSHMAQVSKLKQISHNTEDSYYQRLYGTGEGGGSRPAGAAGLDAQERGMSTMSFGRVKSARLLAVQATFFPDEEDQRQLGKIKSRSEIRALRTAASAPIKRNNSGGSVGGRGHKKQLSLRGATHRLRKSGSGDSGGRWNEGGGGSYGISNNPHIPKNRSRGQGTLKVLKRGAQGSGLVVRTASGALALGVIMSASGVANAAGALKRSSSRGRSPSRRSRESPGGPGPPRSKSAKNPKFNSMKKRGRSKGKGKGGPPQEYGKTPQSTENPLFLVARVENPMETPMSPRQAVNPLFEESPTSND